LILSGLEAMDIKLSTKGRYGIRAMYDLALYHGKGPQTVKAISERQGVPEAYLEQLIARMRKADLVVSVRGPQGGYYLADEPGNITIGAILRAAEGTLAPANCVEDEDCENAQDCAMHVLWERIHEGVNALLNAMTLKEMIKDHRTHDDCPCRQ
jgi:Rrf2 family protein